MWPDMRRPLNTRPGVWRWPIEPGERCESETPWVAGMPPKLWRFMTPAKPLPMVVPVTSTASPSLKMSALISLPAVSSVLSASVEAELHQRPARSDVGLARSGR